MVPGYGVGINAFVFGSPISSELALLQKDILTQVQSAEPAVSIESVTVAPLRAFPNTLNVQVQFTVAPSTAVNTIDVAVGGTTLQITSP